MSVIVALSLVSSVIAQTNVTLNFNRIPADVVSFQGVSGTAYMVEVSTNLSNWNQLVMLNGSVDGFHSHTNFPKQSQLFYRVMEIVGTNNGLISVLFDPSTPASQVVQVSSAVETPNVSLMVFDVNSSNINGTLQGLTVVLHSSVTNVNQLFNGVMIRVNGSTYYADSVSPQGVAIFSNLNIPLPVDTTIPVTIRGNVAKSSDWNSNGDASVWVSVAASGNSGGSSNNPVVLNSSYSTIVVNSLAVAGNMIVLSDSVLALSNGSVNRGVVNVDNQGNGSEIVKFTFTVSNFANDNLYLSKDTSYAATITTTGGVPFSVLGFDPTSAIAGDGSTYFNIPSGASRTFAANIQVSGLTGTVNGSVSVVAINYGTSSVNPVARSVIYGLEPLSTAVSF